MRRRTIRRRRSPRRGAALLIAILVLLVMTIAGVALMFNTSTENALAGNETRMSKAFYSADSGIQYAAAKVSTDINFLGGGVRYLPGGMSSNTLGQTANKDITVAIAQPLLVKVSLPRAGDEMVNSDGIREPVITNFYRLEATATSNEIRASKVISAELSLYPQFASSSLMLK